VVVASTSRARTRIQPNIEEEESIARGFRRATSCSTQQSRFKTRLFLFPHQWSDSDTNQQPFWRDEASDRLAPGFFLVLDEHSISSRFKLRSRLFDTVNIKLKPCLWDGNAVRPSIFAETRLCRLRKRPQGKTLCALKRFGMKIAVTFFFERDTEHFSVQLATFARLLLKSKQQCPLPRLRPTESRIINYKVACEVKIHLNSKMAATFRSPGHFTLGFLADHGQPFRNPVRVE
jgi:hypothetical protein